MANSIKKTINPLKQPEVTMTDFENKRINKLLKEFKKDVKGITFLGVPITELNKSQL